MSATLRDETVHETIMSGRKRYLTHTNDLMMVVIDFNDGPATEPDPPHHHEHEQITYVAEGEFLFFVGDTPYRVKAGDMVTIPSNVPHTVQLISKTARLVDTFNPIRQEFLDNA